MRPTMTCRLWQHPCSKHCLAVHTAHLWLSMVSPWRSARPDGASRASAIFMMWSARSSSIKPGGTCAGVASECPHIDGGCSAPSATVRNISRGGLRRSVEQLFAALHVTRQEALQRLTWEEVCPARMPQCRPSCMACLWILHSRRRAAVEAGSQHRLSSSDDHGASSVSQ